MAEPESGERCWALLLVAAVVAIQAIALAHELSISRFDLNDNVFHYRLTARMAEALEQGGNPFDFWVSEWTLGYPVPRTYQPLGHLALAGTWLALGKSVELLTLFAWARYLLLCLWPLTVYASARALTLRPAAAAAAALWAPLVATDGLFGLEAGSYLWRGSGLFTQCLAMHLLAASLGLGYRALASGRRLTLTGVVLGLTFLAHFIYGYIAALSLVLLALVEAPRGRRLARRRFARTAFAGAVAFVATAFHLLPLLADAPRINRSRWEPAWKWDSFGAREVLAKLLSGELLDAGRLPVLSLLALAGAVAAVLAWRRRRTAGGGAAADRPAALFILSGAVLWLLLFCGRPTWGALLDLLGMGETMHLHRLLGGAHFFLILLAGLGLGGLWGMAARRRRWGWIAAALATLALLYPGARERWSFLAENRRWGRQNLEAHRAEGAPLAAIIEYARREPGRIFPGLGGGWGKDFRVGWVPLYAHLGREGVPAVAYLYHAMALTADVMVHFDEWRPDHYRLFNVSAVLAPEGRRVAPFLTAAAGAGRFRLYRAPAAGYFDLVEVPAAAAVDRRSFYDVNKRWLDSGWPAARRHLRLDLGGSGPPRRLPAFTAEEPPDADAGGLGAVEWEERDGEVYRARVRLDRPAHLLFKMTFHRNWRVVANGEERETVMLTPGFVGVALEPGGYEIECRYRPEGWRTVLLVLALPLVFAAWLAERRPSTAC